MSNMKHLYQEAWEYQGYRIINCQGCGFAHIDPEHFDLPLDGFYQNRYFREVKPFPYTKITDSDIEKQKQQIKNQLSFQTIYRQVSSFLKTGNRHMLDVGCGNDLLSLFFKEQGWETTIIEPSRDAALYLKKVWFGCGKSTG